MKELNLAQARIKFKLRSRMLEVRNNFKGEHKNASLECQGCHTSVDTQDHVLFCPSYSDLRQDLDLSKDNDLTQYYRKDMEIVRKLEKRSE